MDDYWMATRGDMTWCSRKTQLLCLGELLSQAKGRAVEVAWRTLSDLCHYRPYQITPLASEIDNAITLADVAISSLRMA